MKLLCRIILFFLTLLTTVNLYSLNSQYSIAPGADISSLGKKAKEITLRINRLSEDGEKRIHAVSDFHAVFDIKLKTLAEIISDHDNGEKVFKRMIDTVDLNPEDPLTVPHRQKIHTSAKFLGIGQDYIYTTIVNVVKFTSTEFVMNWRLIDCEEGNFKEYEGFWYLQSLESVDGAPRTYIRCYAETQFDNPIPLQDTIMKIFTKPETQEIFESVYSVAAEIKK